MPKAQNKFDLPGVYKLNCANCSKFYIGQTGRDVYKRQEEQNANDEQVQVITIDFLGIGSTTEDI